MKKGFINELMSLIRLSKLKPNEVHTFNIHASFGNYEVIIGPQAAKSKKQSSQIPVEINGELDHLYISPSGVFTIPTQTQIKNHLKDCVMIRNISLHLKDPTGRGLLLEKQNSCHYLTSKEKINFDLNKSKKDLAKMDDDISLAKKTYRIVQKDILNALASKT